MRTTGPLLKVLQVLLEAGSEVYGLELLRATGLKSGTLYPLLERMVEEGWVTRRWETGDNPLGPRRRFYRLTSYGVHEGQVCLAEVGLGGSGAWAR